MSKKPRAAKNCRKKAGLDVAPAGEMLKPASETTAIESAIEPAVDPMAAFEKALPQPPMCRNRLMLCLAQAQLNLPIRQREHCVLRTFFKS